MAEPQMQIVGKIIPILIIAIVIVVLGNAWWDNKGKEQAQEVMRRPGLSWLLPGLPILLLMFLSLEYAISGSFQWWYIVPAVFGSLACMGFLKIIVMSTNPRYSYIELLSSTFPNTHRNLLREASNHLRCLNFEPNETIFRQGEQPDQFYIISQGEVVVSIDLPIGKKIWLNALGPGDFFGEIGLLECRSRTATVRAQTRVEVLALEAEMFVKILNSSKDIANNFNRVSLERLQGRRELMRAKRFQLTVRLLHPQSLHVRRERERLLERCFS